MQMKSKPQAQFKSNFLKLIFPLNNNIIKTQRSLENFEIYQLTFHCFLESNKIQEININPWVNNFKTSPSHKNLRIEEMKVGISRSRCAGEEHGESNRKWENIARPVATPAAAVARSVAARAAAVARATVVARAAASRVERRQQKLFRFHFD
ncbi:hypothetical protein MANES_12G088290v8 [Manihot esculenta]|uniref:Uncharacterized protein n=2 Tax=Manihot esculenta TaxID=3983 RepID=A0ACB7GQI9_MANES|nr:hypothetical protein MANES_12G088290v8 [Manihot esculenta]